MFSLIQALCLKISFHLQSYFLAQKKEAFRSCFFSLIETSNGNRTARFKRICISLRVEMVAGRFRTREADSVGLFAVLGEGSCTR